MIAHRRYNPPVDNRGIESILNEIAQLLELRGTNVFKVRAYQNGARAVGSLQEEVKVLVAEKRLKGIKGVGKSLEAKLKELVETGKLVYLDELRDGIPAGLFEILKVPGMGPKKTKILWDQLEIVTLKALEDACKTGLVAKLKGFGKKTEDKILDGIAHLAVTRGRRLRSEALPHAERLLERLRALPQVERAEVCGSLRRGRETVKDVDILVASTDAEPIMAAIRDDPEVDGIIGSGSTKTSVRLKDGLQVDVRVLAPDSFACGLAYFTGSKEFNVAMRQLALEKGYSLNEYTLRPLDGSKAPALATEAELHAQLGVSYVPPHLRETAEGLLAGVEDRIPTLVEAKDLKGVLHVHTLWSDGAGTVEQMVQQAVDLGYDYIGISDHTQAADYANGLSSDRVRAQREEVEAAREAFPKIRIYHGVEADILADGSLDLDDGLLEELDFVIASVHMQLGMTREKMTKRLVRALSHPTVRVFGHPEGRKLLKREASQFDWEAILDAAEKNDVAIEVNGSPQRLDANWVRIRRIRARGLKLCVNPDAHDMKALDHAARFGVVEARRGWAVKDDVINTLSVKSFESDFLRL